MAGFGSVLYLAPDYDIELFVADNRGTFSLEREGLGTLVASLSPADHRPARASSTLEATDSGHWKLDGSPAGPVDRLAFPTGDRVLTPFRENGRRTIESMSVNQTG